MDAKERSLSQEAGVHAAMYLADADAYDGESDVYKSITKLGQEAVKALLYDFCLYVLICIRDEKNSK